MILKESQIRETISNVLREYIEEWNPNSRYNRVSLVNDPKVRSGREWAKHGGNFPVERNGKIFYVSRSVAVSLYCYCLNKNGEWCILANKRGPGCQNNRGLWNVVCGYLDYNRDAESQAALEAWQETGVKVPLNKIRQQGVNSRNLSGAQNVTIRFAAVLDGVIDDYPLSAANCEPGEVDDIQWIPLSQVNHYQWAFGQWHKVIEQAKTSLNYENGVIKNDLPSKINTLKQELKGNPYAEQLFAQILQDLKDYKTI